MANQKPDQKLYAPPWRAFGPDGKLGAPYGPGTAATFSRHLAAHRDWSYRRPSKVARGLEGLVAWMEAKERDVPAGELRVYLELRAGHSLRFVARNLGVSRETVRSYLRRLKARVK